jgi:hypothetical protein
MLTLIVGGSEHSARITSDAEHLEVIAGDNSSRGASAPLSIFWCIGPIDRACLTKLMPLPFAAPTRLQRDDASLNRGRGGLRLPADCADSPRFTRCS